MRAEDIRTAVEQAVRRLTPGSAVPIDFSRSAVDNGVDSLALLVLRESLERALQAHISDEAWLGFSSLNDVVAFLVEASGVQSAHPRDDLRAAEPVQPTSPLTPRTEPLLKEDGRLYDAIEVGMPMTGRNGLSETSLLKWLGHLRWCHISAICGVPSKDVRDVDGQRLYPTFFFVDLWFPGARHMATYQENDRINAVCTLQRFGHSMLDGVAYLLPPAVASANTSEFGSLQEAVAAGYPVARLSNIFVKQFGGAEWLKKGRPSNPGFEKLPEVAVPPDSYALAKAAEKDGFFARPSHMFVPVTDGWQTAEYEIVPDRDLNGAGLVYFANYPVFVDICERQVLKACRFAFSDALLDRRSLVRRRSAYLNNASSTDTLIVGFEAWIENPALAGHPDPKAASVKLFVNSQMRRRSDGRLMLVCTTEKVLAGVRFGDLPFGPDIVGPPGSRS